MILGGGPKMIPCISLWQPWASWIALGWKTIETRTHMRFASLVGRRIGIHASMRWDNSWREAAHPFLSNARRGETVCWERDFIEKKFPNLGIVVCTAMVSEHRACDRTTCVDSHAALIECNSTQRFGLILSGVKTTTYFSLGVHKQPVKGKQGIFYIPESLVGENCCSAIPLA